MLLVRNIHVKPLHLWTLVPRKLPVDISGGSWDCYLISTTWTSDAGWETMVFKAKIKNEGSSDRLIVDWMDIDEDHYATKEEALDGHFKMVRKYVAKASWVSLR